MILRYHVTAKWNPQTGMRTHERGIGSFFHWDDTEKMREKAMEIARKTPYTTISVCAPRKDGIADVYFMNVWGTNILHKSYSGKLTREESKE